MLVPVIDASIFLGMNHEDSVIRNTCLQIILNHYESGVELNLEQVGLCDMVIWQRGRCEQDAYYPFMDYLHTVMKFRRVPYLNEAYESAINDSRFNGLHITRALVAAHVVLGERQLYTVDPLLTELPVLQEYILSEGLILPVRDEFPEPLNSLYEKSLELKLSYAEVSCVQ